MIYILRHGLDDESLIGGWSDVELLDEGIRQIQNTIQFMKTHSIVFEKIYSSDIKRAKQTAQLVSNVYGITPIFDQRFRELDKGLLTGLEREQAKKLYPDYVGKMELNKKYPKGESMIDLYHRQKEVLDWLLEQNDILVVAHRGTINMYYYALNQIELSNDKEKFGVSHGSLHELDPKQKVLRKIYEPKESRKK